MSVAVPRQSCLDVAGFTLLEAIVALVILTSAGLALFSWINASFDGLNRIEYNNAKAAAEINAMEYLKTVNPMERPDGEVVLGGVTMRWAARPITDVTPNMTDGQTAGPFMVALYETEVSLAAEPRLPRYSFILRQMGYQRSASEVNVFGEKVVNTPKNAK